METPVAEASEAAVHVGASGMPEGPATLHVRSTDDGWAVVREGGDEPLKVTSTKKAAVKAGKSIAQDREALLVVHKANGDEQKTMSFVA